jgi:hypothetical protein
MEGGEHIVFVLPAEKTRLRKAVSKVSENALKGIVDVFRG